MTEPTSIISSGPTSPSQGSRLAPLPALRLQGPSHQSATVRRAWQAIAHALSRRLGLLLPEPTWSEGPDCAIYCRGSRLARIQPESQSVEELTELVAARAACLLSLADTAAILAELYRRAPVYQQEMERLQIPPSLVHAVLCLLLSERVSIGDLETILGTLIAEWKPESRADTLLEKVRERLGAWLCETLAGPNDELCAITLAPKVESLLAGKVSAAHSLEIDSEAASRFMDTLHETVVAQEADRVVVICTPSLRLALFRLLERGVPGLPVLSWNEIAIDYGVNVLARVEHRF